MRLWTLHPKYLDKTGLIALWRETLLAQMVLTGIIKGYRNHLQLLCFRNFLGPAATIADYLVGIYEKANRRGYQFDISKIGQELCKKD